MGWRGLSRARKVLAVVLAVVLALVVGLSCYLLSYNHAKEHALGCISGEIGNAAVELDGGIAFLPSQETDLHTGLVIYPGGKVEYRAYAPLAQECAERGITCVIAEMPANLAFLDVDAASDLMPQLSDVEHWYVGGHSLGGVAAAQYASEHAESLDGVVLMASYSTEDLGFKGLSVLSIRGSLDGVLDEQEYWENRPNIVSDNLAEVVIDGGNHSQFGCYGLQEGDNAAAITEEEQIRQTANAIAEMTGATIEQKSAA